MFRYQVILVSRHRFVIYLLSPLQDYSSSLNQPDHSTPAANLDVPVSFRVWDVDSTKTDMWNTKQQFSSSLGCLQRISYSRASVFLVLWRMSDGVNGLNKVTRCLMDIYVSVSLNYSSLFRLVAFICDQIILKLIINSIYIRALK